MPKPFNKLTAIAAPIMRANIDTDVIIRIERLVGNSVRGSLDKWAFGALRYLPDGSENPEFILNREPYRQAEILVTGPNFGCGSSREGAVWSLQEMGIRTIIGSSFGDIFFANCFQNGLLPIVVDKATADKENFAVGETIGVQAEGPVNRLKISGLVKFGSVSTIGGATLSGFDLPTAQRLFGTQALSFLFAFTDCATNGGGDFHLYLLPAKGERRPGAIMAYWHEAPEEHDIIARSLAAWLAPIVGRAEKDLFRDGREDLDPAARRARSEALYAEAKRRLDDGSFAEDETWIHGSAFQLHTWGDDDLARVRESLMDAVGRDRAIGDRRDVIGDGTGHLALLGCIRIADRGRPLSAQGSREVRGVRTLRGTHA